MNRLIALCIAGIGSTSGLACSEPALPTQPDSASANSDWRAAEKGILEDHVQLTFSDRFVKAGESYFSPDDSKIIFQAVEKPPAGREPDEFYAMFVADVVRGAAPYPGGRIAGLTNIKRLSPEGSANTCGWFHPTRKDVVIFASTIVPPTAGSAPGYQRATGRYKWSFPPEMRIVECELGDADGTPAPLKVIAGDATAYCAEGSFDSDGRHLLYCSLESGDGDLYVKDTKTGRTTRLTQAKGYDGGPFFSPDGKRICYRSDRMGDNLLQLFVAELAFNEKGEITGIQREYQLTDNEHVNWCPFWTPDGRRLIYSTSELGESNYEIFMIDADPGNLPGSNGTVKYGASRRRLTHFDHAESVAASDVLPALSRDGKWMIWASRRGPDGAVQLWAARLTLNPDAPWKSAPTAEDRTERSHENQITIEDPDTGRVFVYDMAKHTLSEYNRSTHQLAPVTDPADIDRFMKLHERQGGKQ